jgi:hypothetical protein
MGFGFLNGFCSNSSKDSEFVFEALSVVGAVDARTRQLGGREHRCMRAGRRRVLCSATVHCDETAASSVSPTCCRASVDRARLCWSHGVGDSGSGAWGCGWKYGMRDCGRHWGGRVELRGQRPTVPIWWACERHGRGLVGAKRRWRVSTQNVA